MIDMCVYVMYGYNSVKHFTTCAYQCNFCVLNKLCKIDVPGLSGRKMLGFLEAAIVSLLFLG